MNDSLDKLKQDIQAHLDSGCACCHAKDWLARLASLAQPSGEAVANDKLREALSIALQHVPCDDEDADRIHALVKEACPLPHEATPSAPLGGLTEGDARRYERLIEVLTAERDELARRLTAPRAEGVDFPSDATLARVSQEVDQSQFTPLEQWDPTAISMGERAPRPTALTATAPKVDGDWLDEMVDRRAPEVRAKMEQRVNELRAEAAAPQAEAGELYMLAARIADRLMPAFEHWMGGFEDSVQRQKVRQDAYTFTLNELEEKPILAQPAAQGGEAGRGVDALQDVLAGLPRYGMTTEWYERQEAVKPEGSAFLYSETETRHHSRRVIGRVLNGEYVSLAELTAALAPQRSDNGDTK